MGFVVRPLGPDDAQSYRDLRLTCLREVPEAFGAEFEEEAGRDLSEWQTRLGSDTRAYFGGFVQNELVGIANFAPETYRKAAHKGLLLGVYVAPQHRGSGVSKSLINAVIAHARLRVQQVHLAVGTHNVPALKLYQSMGFEIYGTEPRGLRVGDRFIDEHLMVLFVDKER